MSKEDFTESQKEVLNCLPDTRANISDKLGISIRAVRGRMTGIEEKGGALQRDRDDVWYWDGGENIHRITAETRER